MTNVFVWTMGDIVGCILLGLLVTGAAVIYVCYLSARVVARVKQLCTRRTPYTGPR